MYNLPFALCEPLWYADPAVMLPFWMSFEDWEPVKDFFRGIPGDSGYASGAEGDMFFCLSVPVQAFFMGNPGGSAPRADGRAFFPEWISEEAARTGIFHGKADTFFPGETAFSHDARRMFPKEEGGGFPRERGGASPPAPGQRAADRPQDGGARPRSLSSLPPEAAVPAAGLSDPEREVSISGAGPFKSGAAAAEALEQLEELVARAYRRMIF